MTVGTPIVFHLCISITLIYTRKIFSSLYLAAFPFLSAQSNDTPISQDDPDLKPPKDSNVCYTPECKHTGNCTRSCIGNYTICVNEPVPFQHKKLKQIETSSCTRSCTKTCTTSRVLSYMNASLEPCDHFYKFACGKFINTNRGKSVNQLSQIEKNIPLQMMNYLQNETLPTSPRYARLIKTFFNSCIDDYSNKAEKRMFNSVMEFINKTNGWPLLKNYSWKDENFQWEKFGSQDEYMNFFIYFSPSDYRGTGRFNSGPHINQPGKFVISQELYNNLLSFGQLFGVEKNNVENSLNQMLEVNNKLNGICSKKTLQRYAYENMTVNELVKKYPNISWKEYFNHRIKPAITDDDYVVQVNAISYYDDFNKLIPTILKGDQANYLMWRAISNILASYFDAINSKNYPFELCYKTTEGLFDSVWGFLYLLNNFNNDSFPKDMDEMFYNINKEYITILKNNYWLDNLTKTKLLKTLETMFFVSPNEYFSHDKEIDEYYENLEIIPGDYLRLLSNIKDFHWKQGPIMFPNLGPGNNAIWRFLDSAVIVNGKYLQYENIINISPSYCQGVVYNKERPQYMNYGSMGFTIGHEITHGVDTSSLSRDKNGDFKYTWTSGTSKAKFNQKAECINNRQQYYKVREFGFNLNQDRKQSEDIADYLGIEVAYSAYEKYMETHGPEPLLPGVNYTQRQLFWISYAQMYCATMTEEDLKKCDKEDAHSIPVLRVIGPLSNSLKFADDFHCAPNTKMNPIDKCTLW